MISHSSAWLAVLSGAWFVIGAEVAPLLGIGSPGDPIAATERKRAALEVSYFSGLGALIVFVGGIALARTAVRLARDVRPLEAPAAPAASAPPGEPYLSGLEEPSRETPSGAITKPRRGWRRQQAAAAGSPGAAYLRWPHPQG